VASPQSPPRGLVSGIVAAHHPWGLDVLLDDHSAVTVDLRFIDDDPIIWGDAGNWPPPGTQVSGRIQGTMPNGQVRLTLRLSDQV
jgi:hypothetical protein